MVAFGYIVLVITGAALGGLLGVAALWWRAHATPYPEKLFDDERWNAAFNGADYVVERDIVKAEWDDAGWWEYHSVRNLLHYVLWSMAAPLILGACFWSERAAAVAKTCAALASIGWAPLFCR
jgi:hypothetical protein